MTTHDDNHDEQSQKIVWEVTPLTKGTGPIKFEEVLTELLKPFSPAEDQTESEKDFTTGELINAIEMHLGIPQGDPDRPCIDGALVVDYMKSLGYKCVNTGDLQLQWLVKKRN